MFKNILLGGILMLLLFSCITRRKVIYFAGLKDTTFVSAIESLEPVIKKNDILNINITSLSSEASESFNGFHPTTAMQTSELSGATQYSAGYLVDQQGYIQLPTLGLIKVEGLTKKTLRDTIVNRIISRKLLLNPIVNIRYLNYRVSVLGEVKDPSVFTIPSERVTILEAIGFAGDLTIYAKRSNVLLIREENGKKIIRRLDLTKSDIFNSPYYYLKSNDIVYVEPNKAKVASSRYVTELLPVAISMISLVIIVVNFYH